MNDIVLDVRNLQVYFQTDSQLIKAVDDISLQVERGKTLGIVGESGSGKSVTSLAIMDLVPDPPGRIVGGEIWFRDRKDADAVNLGRLSPQQMQQYRGSKIATIFQEPMSALNPVYTIGFQLVETIVQHRSISQSEARRQAIALLQEVKLLPGDEELGEQILSQHQSARNLTIKEVQHRVNLQKRAILNRYPHELSGGQIQRVTIAIAISCDPTLLIADEPTTALDVTVQASILKQIQQLCDARGMSAIFISHDLGVIAEIADVVAVMYRGKIVESGSVLDIFSRPQNPYTKGLLACRPQPEVRFQYLPTISDFMEEVTTSTGELEIREKKADLETATIGDSQQEERLTQLQQQQVILAVRNLQVGFPVRGMFGETKRYLMAVNDVSFDVYPGETLGLVGESGCGKTTLARTLLQLVKPLNGRIAFEGREIYPRIDWNLQQLRREMQIIFQDPFSSLDPRLSIGAAVMEPLLIHGRGNGKARRDRAAYLLERVGLEAGWMNRYPHEFSGGQRQRICIARALALNPKFIICDESVSALDVSVQAQVLNLLKQLQDEFKLTYIFISHDLSVVEFMSDRIMVMNKGQLEEIGPAEQVYREPQQDYTRQLIAAIPTGTVESIQQRQEKRSTAKLQVKRELQS